MSRALGLDFGTTNTVLALCDGPGSAAPVSFRFAEERVEALRSALCFWKVGAAPAVEAGPWAIERYIDDPEDCRFLQSLKTFSASPHFQGTYLCARRFRFEDLLETLFGRIRDHGGTQLEHLPRRLVVGRPVTFAGLDPDPQLAAERYRAAFRRFGFEEILFVYEPVAAAFFFARRLEKKATALVADFGGGTTDFSIMEFEKVGQAIRAKPLGRGGVGVAGDTFDYRIINNVILPHLGKGTSFRHWGKVLELPQGPFASFAQWNQLSVLKSSDEFRDLKKMLKDCVEPAKVRRFIELVEDDMGYPLYKAVSAAKARLSVHEETTLEFPPLGRDFAARITRSDFETWIAEDLRGIEAALDASLKDAGLEERAIDNVFLTGGTSFVPAVRRIFERRFGAEKIEGGDEMLSIAKGLALIGEREDAESWAA